MNTGVGRYIASQGLKTPTVYKRLAAQLHKQPSRFTGQNLLFGYGYSNTPYDLETSAYIAAWGIRKCLVERKDGTVDGNLLILIPDALEHCNARAALGHDYKFIPLSEPLADEKAGRMIYNAGYYRKETLKKKLREMGYPPITYEVKTAREIALESKRREADGRENLPLEKLEKDLFEYKNMQSCSYQDLLRAEGLPYAKVDKAKGTFYDDVSEISIKLQGNKIMEKLHEIGAQCKSGRQNVRVGYSHAHWKLEYVVKQTALILYMAFGHEPNYPIKIGPMDSMEPAFDKICIKLLENEYVPKNPVFVHPIINSQRLNFGAAYVKPPSKQEDPEDFKPIYGPDGQVLRPDALERLKEQRGEQTEPLI